MSTNPNQTSSGAEPRFTVLVPRVDVSEDGAGLTLLADLPGVPKTSLHLRVEGDTLSIDAEVAPGGLTAADPAGATTPTTRYQRAFNLSRELDTTQVAAEFDLGVLKVRIPKTTHAQSRKIDVQVH